MKKSTLNLTTGALIAAAYIVLTYVAQLFGLASGVIQFRLSEALTILPIFTWAAIPGLAIGCLLANLLTGCALWDIVFGSIATLIGAFGTYFMRKKAANLAWIPPVLSNAIIIPFVLQYAYGVENAYWYLFLTVGLGELICCGLLGFLLYRALRNKVKYLE